MVRAPCCDKMGLKKGPWTPQEDHILTTYINQNGHGNWRALPKQAGLMRCGKSCRLRWMNYLRPDIKRGNFTTNEEETIIQLHQELGNKWSVIAARLPGRTDNEIKNVWNTHLKKRQLNNGHYPTVPVPMPISVPYTEPAPEPRAPLPDSKAGEFDYNWGTSSPARSISEVSSASASASASEDFSDVCETAGFLERWPEDFRAAEWSGFTSGDSVGEYGNWGGSELGLEIGNEFWDGLLLKNHSAEDFIELPEIW